MKFYSYTNDNGSHTKALSLEQVRSVSCEARPGGASAIRFSVRLDYFDGSHESFSWLSEAESKKVYKEIVEILNGRG